MSPKAHARSVATKLARDLADVLDGEAARIRKRLKVIEDVKRGSVRLRPVSVRSYPVRAHEVRDHVRWIVDDAWRSRTR